MLSSGLTADNLQLVPVPESEYHYHRLGGVVAKLNRGKAQFDVLRTEIGSFSDQDPQPHSSRGYFDMDTWEWIERFQVREPPPLRWGVMLGECVHNLRSALDHLVCQLTLLDGGTMDDCSQTQFPIASKSEAQFEQMANHRIPKLSRWHRAMIKRAQPYRAGDSAWKHPLAILADLSNADKHRLINPTYSIIKSDTSGALDRLIGNYQGPGPSPVKAWWILKQGSRLEHDAPWFRIVFDRSLLSERVDVQMGGDLRLGIAFGEMGLDADSYRHIAEYVRLVIEAFMRRFPETKYIDTPRPDAIGDS
jgi:hypothetical protein